MNWKLLGIEETKDKNLIKEAYLSKLETTNPEDKPEEFMELRKAYEEALAFCDEIKEETPVSLWQKRLEELYNDFKRRINLKEWEELLKDPLCTALDSKEAVEEALLVFLSRSYSLPHEVWMVLDDFFHFSKRRNELKEKYPADFIDYAVIYNINVKERLPMYLFEDCDSEEKCFEYARIVNSVFDEDENAESSLEALRNSEVHHPYGDAILILKSDEDAITRIEKLKKLHETYPNEELIITLFARLCFDSGNKEICLPYCESYYRNHPTDCSFVEVYADGVMEDDPIKATDIIRDVYLEREFDNRHVIPLNNLYMKASRILCERQSLRWEKEEFTEKEKLEYCSCLCDLDDYEKAKEVFDTIEPKEELYSYYRIRCTYEQAKEQYKEAMEDIDLAMNTVLNGDLTNEKNAKRLKNIGTLEIRKAQYLYKMGEKEKARHFLEELFNKYQNDMLVIREMENIALEMGFLELLEQCADTLIEAYPIHARNYVFKAYCQYMKGNEFDGEALFNSDYALFIFGGDIDAYLLKIRLLLRVGSNEQADSLITMFEDSNLKDEPVIVFLRASYLEHNDQMEEAYKLLESIYKKREKIPTFLNLRQEYLYRYLCEKEAHTNYKNKKDVEYLLKVAEEGLDLRPDHYGTHDYHAFLLLRLNRMEESLAEYLELEKIPNHSPEIEERIGSIYYEDLEKNAEKALEYYSRAKQRGGNPEDSYFIGVCHYYLGNYEKARDVLLEHHKEDPNETSIMRWLYYSYEALNDLESALSIASEMAQVASKKDTDSSMLYGFTIKALKRMGRYDRALVACDQFRSNQNFNRYYAEVTELYMRLGDYKKVRSYCEKWLKAIRKGLDIGDKADPAHLIIKTHVLEGNSILLDLAYNHYLTMLGSRTMETSQMVMNYKLNYKAAVEIAKRRKKDSNEPAYYYGHMLVMYFRLGNMKEARRCALKVLENNKQKLSENSTNPTLFHARNIEALAVLGLYEEAEKEIEYCKTAPKCLICEDVNCRDIVCFEAFLEEARGNYDKAMEIVEKAMKEYPHEEDFVLYARYYRKKVKKK